MAALLPDQIKIACASAFWGDTPYSTAQVLTEPDLDFIVYDYLSEVTMAILARLKSRDPKAGAISDFFSDVVVRHLAEISKRKIKIVCNAGALNPRALKNQIEEFAKSHEIKVTVACVGGDDLLAAGTLPSSFTSLDGESIARGRLLSANAYLGAYEISEALNLGADIVVTGRVVDSALVVGPIMHRFKKSWSDFDFLAQASLAGHILECGTQACGGNFTDWRAVPSLDNVGFPVARFSSSGELRVGKIRGTGGLISPASVAEQIVYEIGNPKAYLLPDVVCDFSNIRIESCGQDEVIVSGSKGSAPSGRYKVCATMQDGYKISSTAIISGFHALEKSRVAGDAIVSRVQRARTAEGLGDFAEIQVEALGSENDSLLRISAAHSDVRALEILAKEMAPASTSLAPGFTNLIGGRASPQPRVKLTSFLIETEKVKSWIEVGSSGEQSGAKPSVEVHAQNASSPAIMIAPSSMRAAPGQRVVDLAWARSGDKGNDVNIGVIARGDREFEILKSELTPSRIASFFAKDLADPKLVEMYLLPELKAINFVLKNALGGGGAYSLRADPQGKAFAQRLLHQMLGPKV